MKFTRHCLESTVSASLVVSGVPDDEARLVAKSLVHADMRGIHTHGVNFLPKITQRIERNLLNVPTDARIITDDGSVCHIDGNNGFGQVAATMGMERAIEHAHKNGIGLTLIRNTNHIGLLAFYSVMAADKGMIGFAACNSAPSMAPWGGLEPMLGTNPFSVAAPAGDEHPIALDMSTTVVARGRIRRALDREETIPAGWAFNADGQPTEDPVEAMNGTLMPIGGAKGYGMAFFIDLICGLLSGSRYGRDVLTFHKPEGATGVGVMVAAIEIERFMPLDVFHSTVTTYIQSIRESRRPSETDRIYLPGEIEALTEARSAVEGIELDVETVRTIDALLKRQGVSTRLMGQEPGYAM